MGDFTDVINLYNSLRNGFQALIYLWNIAVLMITMYWVAGIRCSF